MIKNFSARQLALFASLIIVTIYHSLYLIFFFVFKPGFDWRFFLIMLASIFGMSYLTFWYFLQHYVYRRIKLIYKIISRSKQSTKASTLERGNSPINAVENDVMIWASQQESEIEESEALEAYRREYLGNVSHELKTPIFNIQGYIHTLMDGALEDPTINMRYLSRAAKNVERLQTIVEDLESISKLESGELILDIQRFDLKTLAEEVIEDLEYQASEKKIKIQFKDGASPNFHVFGDREYFRQVFVNLLSNSIKYGKNGGSTKISFYDLHGNVLIEISDNGIGIAESHLKYLFDRFYRVDKSRSREEGGSGLGLAIVKHIIEAHDQKINVRSTIGSGTTFGFTIRKA
ncbi:MAG: ATP-binding protein [Saprospiraceae bacterium]